LLERIDLHATIQNFSTEFFSKDALKCSEVTLKTFISAWWRPVAQNVL